MLGLKTPWFPLGNAAVSTVNAYQTDHVQEAAPAVTDRITSPSGAPGLQYADGVQTFGYQDGGTSGGNVGGVLEDVGAGSGGSYDLSNPFTQYNFTGAAQLAAGLGSPSPVTVATKGAQGMWGEAEDQLGPGASNAAILQYTQQLLTANPGVTTLREPVLVRPRSGA